MSHDPRAHAASAPAVPSGVDGRRLRTTSLILAGLFVPATVLAGIVTLVSENAGRCLAYGEHCSSTPGAAYLVSLAVAAVAFAIALGSDRATVRRVAFWTQLGAESVFLMLVMTAFA